MTDRPIYHPLHVLGAIEPGLGSFWNGWTGDPASSSFGTTLWLENTRPGRAWIEGIRALNSAWDVILLSLGPIYQPVDIAAFNLDAIPGPPVGRGHLYPYPENPRFVHYPMGFLEPGEKLPIRACSYSTPAAWPTLNLIVFVTDEEGAEGDGP